MGYLSAHHWAQKEIHYRQARWRREHPAPGMPVEKRRATLTLAGTREEALKGICQSV